jgi:hypothetical protein
MKKRILLFTALSGLLYVTLSSNLTGPAASGNNNNRTGAKNSPTTCGTVGTGCHGGTGSATTVTITVDSNGNAVTHYVAGKTYTINIAGTNSSNNPKFGFEFASVSGTGSSQVQAGTASGFPANVGSDLLTGLNFVEHHTDLAATSPGVYNVSFQWTAPAAGTGTVTLYCTLNAVTGITTSPEAQDISNNISIMLTEVAAGTAVNTIPSNVGITAYPNPVSAQLNLKMDNANVGTYTMNVFDLGGKRIMSENVEVSSTSFVKAINTSNWVPGFYSIQLMKDGTQRTIPVVKQ